MQGMAEGLALDSVGRITGGRVGVAPVRRGRVAGPDGAHLARGAVADRDDEVHVRRARDGKLVPGLAAPPFRGHPGVLQHVQRQGVRLLAGPGAAARRPGLKAPRGCLMVQVVQQVGEEVCGSIEWEI